MGTMNRSNSGGAISVWSHRQIRDDRRSAAGRSKARSPPPRPEPEAAARQPMPATALAQELRSRPIHRLTRRPG
jgi:hypothetical protein